MATTLRKQREVQQREIHLMDVARRMLIAHGYAGLSMDRLAEATEYSKGTIYQHFSTKEDLVMALATQSMHQRASLFERLKTFQGRPRERMQGAGIADEIFARLYPHSFRSELIIKLADLDERASAERQNALRVEENCGIAVVQGFIKEAISVGDLDDKVSPGQILFAIVSLVIGTHTVSSNFKSIMTEAQIDNPFASLRHNINALLDGFGWKPLSTEWDYAETQQRVIQEVFADEWRRLNPNSG